MARRYPYPVTDFGRRQLRAYLRMGGDILKATAIRWDLDPIRWAMRHELKAAARAAKGMN